MSAPVARVGELAEQVRGVSYEKEDASPTPQPGYLPVLRAGNITDEGLVFDDLVFVPAERISAKQRIRRHDVVIAASSGSLDVVGKAAPALADFEGGFGAFCKVLRPNSKVDPGYFAQFFKTQDYRRRVSALAAGANINNLRNEHLDEMQIPLPSMWEQRRIAAVLDQAEALRAKRRAALAQFDTLIQSIFLGMFGDPATNPKRWTKAPIRETVEPVSTWNPLREAVDAEFEYIDISSIDPEAKSIIEPRRVRCAEAPSRARQLVRASDVLVSTVRPNLNAVALVPQTLDGAIASTGFCILRANSRCLESQYLFAYVRSNAFISAMVRQATGASYPAVTDGVVHSTVFPVPPLTVQQDFARRAAAVEKLKVTHRASLTELDALFASLQHRAFRGEL